MVAATERKTAEERREAVIDAAMTEFARHGFEGASTDAIARRVGISQPYLFRLFGTKKELFMASVELCLADTLERFKEASEGLTGEEALRAMGEAYMDWITADPRRLRAQLQSYAACDDPEICAVVRRGFGRLVEYVETKGVPPARISSFFARGMMLNVIAAMSLLGAEEPWAKLLIEGCRECA